MSHLLVQSDARRIPLGDGSVHVTITSPPYFALRSYLPDGHPSKHLEIGAEPTPAEFVATMVQVGREIRRVLRDDGTWWLNLGDCHNSAASNKNGGGLDGKVRGGNRERGRNKRICSGSTRYRLRRDLTTEQVSYVLSELAKARLISAATQEWRE